MALKWYETSYRRNLVDMHIHDWNDEFLSQFSPNDYVDQLKRAHIRSAMLYFQSHVGLCYYPTKVGVMHRAFVGQEDKMRQLVDLCHANGIDVIGYYSLIFNTVEEQRHPEWRMIDGEGEDTSKLERGSRYGHCCPNNAEYRAFIEAQIREMSEYFSVEGMFYDMTFWSGRCRCPACRKRFFAETGLEEIPTVVDWNDSAWRTFQQKRHEWISEFAAWVTSVSRKYFPNASVEHNYAYGVAGNWDQASCEGINDACDYAGGDLYGDVYNHTFTAKYYRSVTKNAPFEYMTSRFAVDLKQHTMSKSAHELTCDVMLNAAHHGASFIIDAMDPRGTIDHRVYDRIGEAFEKQIPHEPYFRGRPIEDVAVFYSVTGRFHSQGEPYFATPACVGLTATLVGAHIPVGVLSHSTLSHADPYKMIFAPAVAGLSEEDRFGLLTYVQNGGALYFSGAEEPLLLKAFFDADVKGYTEEKYNYIAPVPAFEALFGGYSEQYPIASLYRLPMLCNWASDATVMAHIEKTYGNSKTHWSSIHSNPPGILTDAPAFLHRRVGRGQVYWSAAPLELERNAGVPSVFVALTHRHLPEDEVSLSSTAPARVELLAYRGEGELLVTAIDLLCGKDPIKLYPFEISLCCNRPPIAVRSIPDGASLGFAYENGRVTFTIPPYFLFGHYQVEFEQKGERNI